MFFNEELSYDMMCSNSQDKYGDTPLIVASEKGHVTTCALLVKRGATVDFQDKVRLDHFGNTEYRCIITACGMVCSVYKIIRLKMHMIVKFEGHVQCIVV